MESIQSKRRKNKKKIAVLSSVGALTVIGSTLAYFTTSDEIINNFKSGKYQTTINESFTAPNDWAPGDTVKKEVKVTNTGDVPIAVRANFTEKWLDSNGNELSLTDNNGNTAAIINFNSGWTKDSDGYYYYGSKANKTVLDPTKDTNSFIDSVTFNSNITASLSKTVSDDGKTITYTSDGTGYDNARYILTIRIDTIQYSSSNIW